MAYTTSSEILQVYCSQTDWTPITPIRPEFWVFPLDHISDVGINPYRNLNLISRKIIVKVFQPMWKTYLNVTDRQTDGRLCVASLRHALRRAVKTEWLETRWKRNVKRRPWSFANNNYYSFWVDELQECRLLLMCRKVSAYLLDALCEWNEDKPVRVRDMWL